MSTNLSALALGVAMACAGGAVMAGPTITTTQAGSGNSAYAEQDTVTRNASAVITQVGNNNVAGDPVSRTPGILQSHVYVGGDHPVSITQAGDANQASLTQANGMMHYGTHIAQTGNANAASAMESGYMNSDIAIEQSGNYNVAGVLQSGGGSNAWVFQNGDRNAANIENNLNDSTSLTRQTGADNRLDVVHTGSDHSGVHIEQTGNANAATTVQVHASFVPGWTLQTGNNNLATITQTNTAWTVGVVRQNGDDNHATLTQTMDQNQGEIQQTGNLNDATLQQSSAVGYQPANTAYITQAGNGFSAVLVQAGTGNHAGTYQH